MAFARWTPGRSIFSLKDDLDRLFDDFTGREPERHEGQSEIAPRINLEENDHSFILSAELPGISKNDVRITFRKNKLIISGEKTGKDIKSAIYHRHECAYGKFYRSIEIPGDINPDKISADFENGILTVTAPKSTASKSQEIEIKIK
ncbi:MAG: Hsp20/alpha crystallin family protein [Calditrichaceae bacterium]